MDLDTLGYFLYMDKMEKQQQAERERNPFDEDGKTAAGGAGAQPLRRG